MKNSHKKVLLLSSLAFVVSMVLVTDAAIYIKTGFNFYPKDQTAAILMLPSSTSGELPPPPTNPVGSCVANVDGTYTVKFSWDKPALPPPAIYSGLYSGLIDDLTNDFKACSPTNIPNPGDMCLKNPLYSPISFAGQAGHSYNAIVYSVNVSGASNWIPAQANIVCPKATTPSTTTPPTVTPPTVIPVVTPATLPPAPTNPVGSCKANADGTYTASFGWTNPTGLPTPTSYSGLIDDLSNDFKPCTPTSTPNVGDQCVRSPMSNPYTFTAQAGHRYNTVVYSLDAKGASNWVPAQTTITCATATAPTSTPPTIPPITILYPVSGVTTKISAPNTGALSWPAVAGAKSYAIYVNGFLWDKVTATSYNTGTVLVPNTTYSFSVQAIKDDSVPPNSISVVQPERKSFLASIWSSILAAVGVTTQPVSGPVVKLTTPAEPVPAATASTSSPMKILTILFDYGGTNGPSATRDATSTVQTKLFGSGKSMKNYIAEVSQGKLNVAGDVIDVGGLKTPAGLDVKFLNVAGPDKALWADLMYIAINSSAIKSLPAGKKLSDYKVIIYVWPLLEESARGVADGIGPVGGEIKGRIWINGIQTASIYAHEFGHKLGLYHADGIACSSLPAKPTALPPIDFSWTSRCRIINYGDPIDTMGTRDFYHFDPYRKWSLGWIPQKQIASSGRYEIVANDIPKETGAPSPTAFFISQPLIPGINTTTYSYYLDYRQPYGFDADLGATISGINVTDGLSIEIVPTVKNNNSFFVGDSSGYDTNYLYDSNTSVPTPYVIKDGKEFYTPYVYTKNSSGVAEPVSGVKVIQISHDEVSSKVFVRFDATTTLNVSSSISPSLVDLKINPKPTFKVSYNLRWGSVDKAAGYELYINSTSSKPIDIKSTGALVYSYSTTTSGVSVAGLSFPYTFYVRPYDAFPDGSAVVKNQTFPMYYSSESIGYSYVYVNGATASTLVPNGSLNQSFSIPTVIYATDKKDFSLVPSSGGSVCSVRLNKYGYEISAGSSLGTAKTLLNGPGLANVPNCSNPGIGLYIRKI